MTPELTISVDPHVHSDDSYDGHEPIELILEHVSDIDLDGVVITDHDRIEESIRAAELAPDYGLIGIPGIEISTRHGHLLGIGIEERIEPGLTLGETVAQVRTLGGIAIVPHPFQRSRHGIRKRRIRNIDAIEVYNSMVFTGYRNARADTFATRRGIAKIGSSDAHHLPNVGRAYTEITIPVEDDDMRPEDLGWERLVAAIRSGSTTIQGKRTPIHKSAIQYSKGAVRKSSYIVTSKVPIVPTVPRSMAQK